VVLAAEPEQVAEAAAPPAAIAGDDRRRRRPLLDPAVLERDVLAERADVDELRPLLRGEEDRAFAHQQRPFADRADAHGCNFRHAHHRCRL
jgi:hypothetical protein